MSTSADLADRYEQLLRLADLFDDAGEQMRARAALGTDIVADPAFAETAPLSGRTHEEAEDAVRDATTGPRGLLARAVELDADALVLRATVLTYRWIDELQEAAYETLGTIAGRAIGYLAPEVALGGAIVAAGLIETDALDRDGVAAYLSELAEAHPELMEHVTTGGGLVDSLQMRALLTSGALAGDDGRIAAGGLRAAGVPDLAVGFDAALRDAAGDLVKEQAASEQRASAAPTPSSDRAGVPADLTGLMTELAETTDPVVVRRAAAGRYLAFLPGPAGACRRTPRRLRVVSGAGNGYVDQVVRAIAATIAAAVADDPEPARVMLVGGGTGGAAAIELAARTDLTGFVIDQVVTAGSPSAQVPTVPAAVRVLSLEDRSDPVALLGSLINAGATNRVTVVYDARDDGTGAGPPPGTSPYVVAGRAADRATHPALVAEVERLRRLGYLSG